jgi:hypothetical protein
VNCNTCSECGKRTEEWRINICANKTCTREIQTFYTTYFFTYRLTHTTLWRIISWAQNIKYVCFTPCIYSNKWLTYIQIRSLWKVQILCYKQLQFRHTFRFLLRSSLVFAFFVFLLRICINNTKCKISFFSLSINHSHAIYSKKIHCSTWIDTKYLNIQHSTLCIRMNASHTHVLENINK